MVTKHTEYATSAIVSYQQLRLRLSLYNNLSRSGIRVQASCTIGCLGLYPECNYIPEDTAHA